MTVSANILSADGGSTDSPTGIFSTAERGSTGKAGPVTVTANIIDLRNQGVISSSTFGPGDAGKVQVTGIGTNSSLTIDGGNLTKATGVISDAAMGSGGAAGNVAVSMDNIRLLHTGQISSNTFAKGDAGPVTVNANILSADGAGRTDVATGIFSTAESGSSGNAGLVTVTANAIDLRNRGVISSSTYGPGQGGSVIMRTGQLLALGSTGLDNFDTGISTSSSTSGRGGNITVAGNTQPLELMISGPGAGIRARATRADSSGAGMISITAHTMSVMDHGEITTSAEAGGGGRIDLAAGQLIRLDLGQITTSVHGGTGDSGDLTATSPFVMLNHSKILANADAGGGGNITITAQSYFASPDSLVQASAARGINGTIVIQAPQSNVAGTLVELPSNLLNPPPLQQRGCSIVAESQGVSSFVVGASGGLPRTGEGPQTASYFDLQQDAAPPTAHQSVAATMPQLAARQDAPLTCCR